MAIIQNGVHSTHPSQRVSGEGPEGPTADAQSHTAQEVSVIPTTQGHIETQKRQQAQE